MNGLCPECQRVYLWHSPRPIQAMACPRCQGNLVKTDLEPSLALEPRSWALSGVPLAPEIVEERRQTRRKLIGRAGSTKQLLALPLDVLLEDKIERMSRSGKNVESLVKALLLFHAGGNVRREAEQEGWEEVLFLLRRK